LIHFAPQLICLESLLIGQGQIFYTEERSKRCILAKGIVDEAIIVYKIADIVKTTDLIGTKIKRPVGFTDDEKTFYKIEIRCIFVSYCERMKIPLTDRHRPMRKHHFCLRFKHRTMTITRYLRRCFTKSPFPYGMRQ
jgi:hypothetical protein